MIQKDEILPYLTDYNAAGMAYQNCPIGPFGTWVGGSEFTHCEFINQGHLSSSVAALPGHSVAKPTSIFPILSLSNDAKRFPSVSSLEAASFEAQRTLPFCWHIYFLVRDI